MILLKKKEVKKVSHSLKLMRRLVVTDKDGKVISDTGEMETESYVIQFLEYIYALFNAPQPGGYSATDVTGVERTIYMYSYECNDTFIANAGINVGTYGLVVGTNAGASPESNTDYSLDTKIAEGAGAGQLTHNAMSWDAPLVVGVNVDLVGKRSFTNNSGATITVKETGIRVRNDPSGYYHLIIRDVVSDTPIPDLCSLTVYYTLRTTVTV